MSTKELILVVGAVLFLVLAIYTIAQIGKLNMSKTAKIALYYLTILIPILGFFLVERAKKKQNN